jgi:hypothetical protein
MSASSNQTGRVCLPTNSGAWSAKCGEAASRVAAPY